MEVENDYLKNIGDIEIAFGDDYVLPSISSTGLSLQYEFEENDAVDFFNNSLLTKGVGEVELTITQNGNCDYAYSEKTVKVKVSKRNVYASVKDENIFFGDPFPDFTISYEGLAFNHTQDSLEILPHIEIDSIASLSLGEHTIKLLGGGDSRYNIIPQSGTLSVYPFEYNSFVFPNPATESVTPVLAVGKINHVSFYNGAGILALEGIPDSTGSISIQTLPAGLYQVRILSAGKSFYTKLIVHD